MMGPTATGAGTPETPTTMTTTTTAAAPPFAGLDRMRKLSAILDDDRDDDDDEALALLSAAIADKIAHEAEAARAPPPGGDGVCVECRAHPAEVFCEQCHDPFCELCFGGQHRKGTRRSHTVQPIVPRPVTTEQPRNANNDDDDELASNDSDGDLDPYNDDDADDDSDAVASEARALTAAGPRRNICDLMGRMFLGGRPTTTSRTKHNETAAGSVGAAEAQATVLERAKYIPVRLTYEERKLLRTLEAALSVSHYTDKLDSPAFAAPAKRLRTQLQEICGFLSGIVVALSYREGQEVLDDKNFVDKKALFQELFELGRRYKIMNPEKMRGEYGKLMYLLQDATSPEIQDLLGFSCHRKIHTVYDVLEAAQALGVLRDPKIEVATMVVAPENKTRLQIQRLIKMKEQAIREISERYANGRINRDGIQQCLYSIADNNYHLYFERDPIDRMIQLLREHFDPEREDAGYSLSILSGHDGARLSHSHQRQYHYVLQSLTLWREIAHDMFRLWCLTDEDLLLDGTPYALADTGQGLHRLQPAPRVSRAMHVILHMTQRKLDAWVGSSVIHLGDKNVPNALMFIDKYTQVGHILRPIVKTIDSIESLAAASEQLRRYVDSTFGGVARLRRDILADFFREAFDGSGADNFFEAGSCIDGRLTSAWNWCSNLHTKPFYPIFKLGGFVGFDGKFA